MSPEQNEVIARAKLQEASDAVQDFRRTHPPFTRVPSDMFDCLDVARAAHDLAYQEYLNDR